MSIQLFQTEDEALAQIPAPVPSRQTRALAGALFLLALLSCTASIVSAQQTNVVIRVVSASNGRIVVEGSCAPATVWSFRDSYAGVLNLGSRVDGLKLFDAAGTEVTSRKIAPGQFQAGSPATKFRYEVSIAPPVRPADAARMSWLNSERGVLMLRDLLPASDARDVVSGRVVADRVTVRVSLPAGWVAHSNETQNGNGEFEVADADLAVFAVGNKLRVSNTTTAGMTLSLVAAGDWAFADSDALELAGKVMKTHRDVFGAVPPRRSTLILFPYPQGGAPDKWSAETRGSSVTLLMGKLPSKVAALAQLSVPLTHELLHFWVPNGLRLDGEYDWFYEGFTIYQAARIGVRLDLLTFQEFLDAIGRAYDGYSVGIDHDRWSLVEASRRRWTVGETSVYSKSMLIAFLYDLKLRNLSHNKHSLDDVYRNIFREYRSPETKTAGSLAGQGSDGSEAVLKFLGAFSGMQDFGRSFISNAAAINLTEQLAPFGLQVETFGLRTRISVREALTRQQRDLLHDLGYNDYVRSPRQRKQS
jgi:predicted metalloprotease with PDZ domain